LIQLESDSEISWEKLNFFLGLEKKPDIGVKFYKDGIMIEKEDLIKESIEKNYEIKYKENELQSTKIQKMLAEKEKYPDFAVGTVLGQDQSGIKQKFYDLTLTFNIPVLDRNQNAVKSLEFRQKSEELQLTYLVRLIEQRIKSGYITYQSSRKILNKLPLTLLKDLEKKMDFADDEFKRGRIDLVTYLELETQMHETHHVIFDSQMEYVEKYLSLLAMTASDKFLIEGKE
jgi:outer membrane protein TolC